MPNARAPGEVQQFQPRILIFLGPVGVGKTTQARLLVRYLNRYGGKAYCTSINTYYPMFLRFISKFGHRVKVIHRDGYQEHALSPLVIKRLIDVLIFLDLLLIHIAFFFKILLPCIVLKPKRIIIEEYLVGILINYYEAYSRGFLGVGTLRYSRTLLNRLLSFGKKEAIVMNAPQSILAKRWIKRNSPPERIEYIRFQQATLESVKMLFSLNDFGIKMKRIDASKDTVSVFKQILAMVH